MKRTKVSTYILSICVLSFSISILSSCSSDHVEEYKEVERSICDTSNLDYQTSIEPILSKNCLSCHDATGPNIRLTSYPQVKAFVKNGRLLGSVKHMPGHIPMPPENALSPCDIEFIEIWIKNGAPEKRP